MLLSTLTLEDEGIHFDSENELSENNHLFKCLEDDFLYIPPQDQNDYSLLR